jgi:hypothetical protein
MSLIPPIFQPALEPRRQRAQTLLEFALALPILLLLIFGIIEFGRFLQAWLALENGARFGVRYAVTGNYDPQYCADAGAALGLAAADLADGYTDCKVPNNTTYKDTWEDYTNSLQDWARLPSIRDAAIAGATGVALDEDAGISGGFLSFLANAGATRDFEQNYRGNP